MGTEHQVYKGEALADTLRHVLLLHHAAAQGDNQRGVPALDVLQSPHIAVNPVLGVLPHGAGIEEDEVSLLLVVGKAEAHLLQHSLDFLPVRHILLAAVGAHQGQGHLPSGPHLHHLGHIGHIAGLLLPVPLGLFCQIGSSLRGFPRFFLFEADFISIPQALFFRKSGLSGAWEGGGPDPPYPNAFLPFSDKSDG